MQVWIDALIYLSIGTLRGVSLNLSLGSDFLRRDRLDDGTAFG